MSFLIFSFSKRSLHPLSLTVSVIHAAERTKQWLGAIEGKPIATPSLLPYNADGAVVQRRPQHSTALPARF